MIIALIPLRGGSKSIPGKNIKPIGGRPLCYWAIKAAVESGVFRSTVVSTDSPEIESVVREFDFGVNIIKRPDELATDTASTESVMLHIAEIIPFETLVTIQATSPLITAGDLAGANAKWLDNDYDSMLSVVNIKRFLWSEDGHPINYDPLNRPRRQDFRGIFMENGAFYFTRRKLLLEERCRLGGKIGLYEMDLQASTELDEEEDWEIVEKALISRRMSAREDIFKQIKLVATDIDGVLTDAGMYYSEKGDELKKFNTRDGKAFELLRFSGMKTAIITSENTVIATRRAEKVKADYLIQGVSGEDKLSAMQSICEQEAIQMSNVAYIGDDVNCIPLLRGVGLSFCPFDAHSEVLTLAGITRLGSKGGEGVFREMADMILKDRNSERINQ